MTVRTRFAPSPTGYLHIGGVRTALFNWLLARRHGGQFVLRIDDTDASRHVEDALEPILDGFRWLGLRWDEGPQVDGPYGPYYQSERADGYQEGLRRLVETGHAYPCQTTPEELDEQRAAAKAAKRPFVYRGPNRDLPPAEAMALWQAEKPSLRFKVVPGHRTVLDDAVRGQVAWDTDTLGDFTIARAGGGPLYNFASIQDDISMRITHVVRAEEHLSNTHPQMLVAQALEAALPTFAHIPFVCAPGTKKKISKRNPPPGVMVSVQEYRDAGYLPEAVINALARLGWSLDDKSEIIPLEQIVANFSLDRVTAASAALDPDKMYWMQDHYMRALTVDERVGQMVPHLKAAGLLDDPPTDDQMETVRQVDAACGDRLKLLTDVVRYGEPFLKGGIDFDAKSAKVLRKDGVGAVLSAVRDKLAALDDFTAGSAEAAIAAVRDELGTGGKINNMVRAAATGRSVGPGVYESLAILGKDRTLANLDAAVAACAAGDFAAAP